MFLLRQYLTHLIQSFSRLLARIRELMFRHLFSNFFVKTTTKAVGKVVKAAFSSKYLLVTNVVLSGGLSGAADGVVQKACRGAGVGKYQINQTG